jgi:hypothetical protein
MPASARRVNDGVREALDDDTEREVQRTAGADERTGQLEIRARLDEEPGFLFAEAEEAELVVAPARDPLVLGGQLVGGWELGCRHNCSNEQIPTEFVGRS